MFLPVPTQEVCSNRKLDVKLATNFVVLESEVQFSTAQDGQPAKISIPLEVTKIFLRLIRSKVNKDVDVGVQLLVGDGILFTRRFCVPLIVYDWSSAVFKTECHQVQGFPAKDGKQQLILAGDISNSAICACVSCTGERHNFGVWPNFLWTLRQNRDGVQGPAYHDPQKRVGAMDVATCAARYAEPTFDGKVNHTQEQKREITVECASVIKPPLLNVHIVKNSSGSLHVSSGIANHGLDECRSEILLMEDDKECLC